MDAATLHRRKGRRPGAQNTGGLIDFVPLQPQNLVKNDARPTRWSAAGRWVGRLNPKP